MLGGFLPFFLSVPPPPSLLRPALSIFFFFHHQLKYKRSLVNDKKYQNDEPKIIYKFTAILPYYNGPIIDQK